MKLFHIFKTTLTLFLFITGIITILVLTSVFIYKKNIYIETPGRFENLISEHYSSEQKQLSLLYMGENYAENNKDLPDLKYPNSTLINDEKNSMLFTSQDHPDQITDWYKNQINKTNFGAKAFIQIKTNGDTLTKFAGTNGKSELDIEISKSGYETESKILVVVNKTLDHRETF